MKAVAEGSTVAGLLQRKYNRTHLAYLAEGDDRNLIYPSGRCCGGCFEVESCGTSGLDSYKSFGDGAQPAVTDHQKRWDAEHPRGASAWRKFGMALDVWRRRLKRALATSLGVDADDA